MKNKKWNFAIVLIMVITVSACAQQYDLESDFKAKPIDGGKGVEITEYIGSKWTIRIPPRIQGLPVTHIGNNAFSNKKLISVTIPNSVTFIGDWAFTSNQLTSVTIPNSVTSIGSGVFSGCTSLTAINVDTSNTAYSSQDGVLYNKNKTTLVAYPKGKTNVSFSIPNSVISIGDWVFSDCTELTSVIISNSVTSIGNNAFSGSKKLATVTIGNSVTSIGDWAFSDCSSLTSVIIPNNVTSIGDWAFFGCTGISSRFLEVLKPLAEIMSKFESVPTQERRDQYDNILPEALTSRTDIYRIFSIWKPNVIDGMDSRNIERPGSTPRGQYAPVFAKENGAIEKSTFTDVNDSMAYITGPNALKERLKPMRFKVNGQDIWILRIELPIINNRLREVVGTVGGYCDIR